MGAGEYMEYQHFSLPGGQGREQPGCAHRAAAGATQGAEDTADDGGVEPAVTRGAAPDGGDQVGGCGVFEQGTARARGESLLDGGVVVEVVSTRTAAQVTLDGLVDHLRTQGGWS
ncbi:hypothetical protein BOX37_07325 [Nocardia mangyaensis]|uniref:Uncharacterized protein n=1 Tax=Nocardia mangyaensis TaxID=2213200 RepID=A0A1J0VP46_9NOCA|nr:hypothetical protein BOX37_07325 [Nocardia mangyaensis]